MGKTLKNIILSGIVAISIGASSGCERPEQTQLQNSAFYSQLSPAAQQSILVGDYDGAINSTKSPELRGEIAYFAANNTSSEIIEGIKRGSIVEHALTNGRIQETYKTLEEALKIEPDSADRNWIQNQMDRLIEIAINNIDYYKSQWGETFTDNLSTGDKKGIGLRPGDDGHRRAEYLVFLADHTKDPHMQTELLKSAAAVYRAGGDIYANVASLGWLGDQNRNHRIAAGLYAESQKIADRIQENRVSKEK